MRAALNALRARVRPRACNGVDFLIHHADWRARLDRMKDWWAAALMDLEMRTARIHLLSELSETTRHSTWAAGRAFALRARIGLARAGLRSARDHLLR